MSKNGSLLDSRDVAARTAVAATLKGSDTAAATHARQCEPIGVALNEFHFLGFCLPRDSSRHRPLHDRRNKNERAFVWFTIVASTIFVMWHVPIYILVMLTTISVDYFAAILIARASEGSFNRRLLLFCSMAMNLAILGFFKYTNFAFDNLSVVLRLAHYKPIQLPYLTVALPIGISFYTFGSMSYTIDVYRKRLKPVTRFADFYHFVTFFPHLVAGPIIRAEQFFYQSPRIRRLRLRTINRGSFLIIRGLFLKMVCADNLSNPVVRYWNDASNTAAVNLMLALLFACQIFADFEGYSSIARGLAYLMGYRFPLNFDNPYIAGSFSNFWTRWHITLSTWLRDYLYIPLGGNRHGASRTYFNLICVMFLGGLWHGAGMTFILWGLLHGIALAIERLIGLNRNKPRPLIVNFCWYVVVQATVVAGWILFRSPTLERAGDFFQVILHHQFAVLPYPVHVAAYFALPVLVMHMFGFLVEHRVVPRLRPVQQAMLAGIMLVAIFLMHGVSGEFIYFQF